MEINDEWARKEAQKVSQHNARARWSDLCATLTVEEWFTTIRDFEGKCAYCLSAPYEQLDHFLPISQGGGTWQFNCVPACRKCNYAKGQRNPYKECSAISIPAKHIIRVNHYLYYGYQDSLKIAS